MLDSKLVSVFKKYPDIIDTIHFSDQYTGPKPTEVSTQYTEQCTTYKVHNTECI